MEINISQFVDLLFWMNQILFAALYISMIWLATMSIQVIIENIQNHFPCLNYSAGMQVRKWWRWYSSVSDFIEKVDELFGPYLLVYISMGSVTFSFYSFEAIKLGVRAERDVFYCLVVIVSLGISFYMFILVTQRMKKKVIHFYNRLYHATKQGSILTTSPSS